MCKYCERGTFKEKIAPNIDDWEDPIYRHPKRRKKEKRWGPYRTSISNHCEANDNGPHISVIVEVHYWIINRQHVRYDKTCVGCGVVLKTYRNHNWGAAKRSPVGYDFHKSDIYEVVHLPKFYW